jgi:hypothetical protein
MPNMDGTGPMGKGPMTGRGMGNCRQYPSRKGGGRWQSLSKEERLKLLSEDKKIIEKEIADLEKNK